MESRTCKGKHVDCKKKYNLTDVFALGKIYLCEREFCVGVWETTAIEYNYNSGCSVTSWSLIKQFSKCTHIFWN
jgi:hypothetical protein